MTGESELSGVDDSSTFERLLQTYVNEPLVKLIPRWVKPNTISVVNHACVWFTVYLAFLASAIDESEEEYKSGIMREGRTVDTARTQALLCRLLMAALVFFSMVLDCLDGMHARATGQTSRLGEVMDHALDAANIPLMSAGAVLTFGIGIWWRTLTMIGCGLVFNSQLTVYRHTGKFVKPPANGPESQMLLITAEVACGVIFWLFGRHHPTVSYSLWFVLLVANIVQFQNAYYFWRLLSWKTCADHLRFAFTVISYAMLAVSGLISDFVFEIGSVLLAFRLSGVYVLYIVANKHQKADDAKAGGSAQKPLHSSWSSLYDGFDWVLLTFVALMGVIQYALYDPRVGALRLAKPESFDTVTMVEFVPLVIFFFVVNAANTADLRKCMPSLVSAKQLAQPMIRLFI